MGGDHKCPVCQATFTRPQHVARHMRSHTGDRPYKCQHCGDQFARSDLLSRHVNKCHAAEKALTLGGGGGPGALAHGQSGRRKGTTAATRATTSKQACDQCVQNSLACDGSNPCAKCVARKTRCTFVKFHRQTAPVGPGHPSSLSASSLPSASLPPLPSLSHPSSTLAPLSHPLSLSGLGGEPAPFLYAQQQAGGAGFSFASPGPPANQQEPRFSANERFGDRFAHPADGRFAHHPHSAHPESAARFAHSASADAGSPTYTSASSAGEYDPQQRRDSYSSYAGGAYAYRGEYEYADSEHSGGGGGSVSGGSRPASSAGPGDYAPYIPNGRHHASASLDLHDLRHPGDLHQSHRPPEFSSAFGLMSLDDPNVLAGLASDGVPFFSRTGLTPGVPPPPSSSASSGHGQQDGLKRSSMQLVPPQPLTYQPYSPPSSSHSHSSAPGVAGGMAQTPGTREAETRELREFWKAYMRTPLTGPAGGDALGLQTPSASSAAAGGMLGVTPTRESVAGANGNGNGNGGRRYRVASLPSVKTPEGEMDAAPMYPLHHHAPPPPPLLAPPAARTMHNADDLRSYEAAVLARKAPELVLRKPTRRPTTSAGVSGHQQQAPPPMFEFGAAASRERGGASTLESQGSQSSLAGAFGFGQGYAAAPQGSSTHGGSLPNSPFPGTPNSASQTSASASEDGDGSSGEGGEGGLRPTFKRLPSQTLGPAQAKRRREPGGRALGLGGGLAPLTLAPPAAGGGGGGDPPTSAPSSVNAYPDRPMIALRAPPNAHPQRRARRLSAPASPTAPGFVLD